MIFFSSCLSMSWATDDQWGGEQIIARDFQQHFVLRYYKSIVSINPIRQQSLIIYAKSCRKKNNFILQPQA